MRTNKAIFFLLMVAVAFSCADEASQDTSVGQGGSMTRFAVSNNYLYLVNSYSILVFDINQNTFEAINEVSIGFGLETIFAKGDYLYLGANDAMYIYSIADPESPSFIFRYTHIESCDPVVVQGNRAYVTLRSGNRCNRGNNALEIIDITNPHQPRLVANYPMLSPHGLGVSGNTLFLCEGKHGLKVFDISDEQSIQLLAYKNDLFAYDIIVEQAQVTVTGEDGIFQFAYPGEDEALTLLSAIPVRREEL
jgi:hypothetical protein